MIFGSIILFLLACISLFFMLAVGIRMIYLKTIFTKRMTNSDPEFNRRKITPWIIVVAKIDSGLLNEAEYTDYKTTKTMFKSLVFVTLIPIIILSTLFLYNLAMLVPVKQEMVYGIYSASYDNTKETLILNHGGTFRQEVNLSRSNEILKTSGRWRYSSELSTICFDNGVIRVFKKGKLRKNYNQPLKGAVIRPVQGFLGRYNIAIEGNPRYVKLKDDVEKHAR